MTGVPENSKSQISAVDEEGTKFYLIENETTSRYHLEQTSSSSKYSTLSTQQSMSHDNASKAASRSKSSHPDPSQSSLNPMEFNFWMFQQHQAAIAAFANSQSSGSTNGEVGNNPRKASSGSRKAKDTTAHDASSQVPIPEHLFSLAPPGFEPVPLVLPPPESASSKDNTSSISNSVLNASDSNRLENSTSKQRGAEKEDSRKRVDSSNGRKHQRSRSRTKKGRRNSRGSSSEDDKLTRKSSKLNKKDRSDEHDEDCETRKRKRSPDSSHIKKDKKLKKSRKIKRKFSKRSKKKKSKASKIPVCEVDNRSCSGTPERYQKSYRSSDEDESLQSDLDSVSSSSFVSSTYSGELSDVSDSLSSISDEDFPQTSSKKGYRGNKESKTLSSQLKICSPIGKSRGIDNYKIPKRSPRNDKRKRSSDREISPRKSSPKRDNKSRTANNRPDDSLERRSVFRRTASRFDDNVKLEDSLQRFRERKGMTPYSSSSSMSPVKRNSFDSRLNSSQPSNVDSLSRESSIISSTEAQTSKDVEKSEDKHPLAADDVSPMDRMRIEQYLIGCKQKYTFNSCGSTPFVDSHCHIDFLFKKTEFKGTLTKFQELVPFPENYGGCVAVFCEPYTFGKFSVFEKILAEDKLVACFGCHPHSANMYDDNLERNIIQMMRHPKVVAWGECGLDYSDRSRGVDKKVQKDVLRRQLRWAVKLQKPICLHSRQSDEDLIEILKEEVSPDHKLHRHCYTETPENAIIMLQHFKNMYFGFTNVLAYSNAADARHTAAIVPLNRILLETDAPYFLPPKAPKAMKNSNPGMAIQVAEQLSFIKRVPVQEVLMHARQNTKDMYGI